VTASTYPVFLDGLPGPTFNYGGLAMGNLASAKYAMTRSNPRKAALQSLYKMKHLADMGIRQIVLPPQERPLVGVLRRLGFTGSDMQVLEGAYRVVPDIVTAVSASSSAWAANGASITPSSDTADYRVHITPANLAHQFHRSLEVETTQMIYYALFPHPEAFVHHDPLPAHPRLGDEGSANQIRLCGKYEGPGIHLMVYGMRSFGVVSRLGPRRFLPRQSLEASEAVVRLHRIPEDRVVFVQQHPDAIDAGLFHNDLVALANQHLLLYHERAWVSTEEVVETLRSKLQAYCHVDLQAIKILESELSLADLVDSYLLNSQLVTLPSGEMIMLAPTQTRDHARACAFLQQLVSRDNPIQHVHYLDLSESMRAGGGPGCLSLSTVLTRSEWEAVLPELILTDALYQTLVDWIGEHYRDELRPGDVSDPELLYETRRALDDLTELLDLGPLYPFQQE
jgi:succinylarginine dihydrolase